MTEFNSLGEVYWSIPMVPADPSAEASASISKAPTDGDGDQDRKEPLTQRANCTAFERVFSEPRAIPTKGYSYYRTSGTEGEAASPGMLASPPPLARSWPQRGRRGSFPTITLRLTDRKLTADAPVGRGSQKLVCETHSISPRGKEEVKAVALMALDTASGSPEVQRVASIERDNEIGITRYLYNQWLSDPESLSNVLIGMANEAKVYNHWSTEQDGLSHETITRLSKSEERKETVIVSELMDGTLDSRLEKCPIEKKQGVSIQMIRGVMQLHALGIIHRDIKSDNFLVNSDLSVVKLADFGKSNFATAEPHQVSMLLALRWHAPEIGRFAFNEAKKLSLDPTTDVYSLGVVLHQLWGGITIAKFDGYKLTPDTLQRFKETPELWPGFRCADFPEEHKPIILQMLNKEPTQRPPLDDVLKHFLGETTSSSSSSSS